MKKKHDLYNLGLDKSFSAFACMSVSQPSSIVQESAKRVEMQSKLGLVISLSLFCLWVESRPAEFEELDADLSGLSYEVEEEDIEDFAKALDGSDDVSEMESTSKTSGFRKNQSASKGVKGKKNSANENKVYKVRHGPDRGSYDDDDVYGDVEGIVGQAVSVTGNEDRKYRKGKKTRGFHRVHHKDEYKKDKVYYEDDETKGLIKKVGAKGHGYKISGGAGFNKGHFDHDRKKGLYGKRGYTDKGLVDKEVKAYSNSQGFDKVFSNSS